MTLYVLWPKTQDNDFRAAYENLTFEQVQPDPDDLGDFWRVATSRATEDDIAKIVEMGINAECWRAT